MSGDYYTSTLNCTCTYALPILYPALMYGPACPCMCLQASEHSCNAGPFPPVFLELRLQSKVKLILTIILQKYLINFNYVTVNLHYMCIHPSVHLCLCVCMYICVCEMCLHASVHNIMCSAQPEVAAVLDWYGPEADPGYWQRGREEVAGLQVACEIYTCRRRILGVSPRIFLVNFRPSYTDHFSIIKFLLCRLPLPGIILMHMNCTCMEAI